MSSLSTADSVRSYAAIGTLVLTFMASCGCTAMTSATTAMSSITASAPWSNKDHDTPVTDILALWQPGEGRDASGLPTRGFAGQMFFFTSGTRTPVAITGDVSVLVFDDQGTVEEQQKPIHEFNFRSGVWDSFCQETNLGPAYQLFVPYTRRGPHQASCSLRVKYTGSSGQTILSEAADVVLTGTSPNTTESKPAVRAYTGRQPSKMTSETIDMPSRFTNSKFSAPTSRRSQLARAGFDANQAQEAIPAPQNSRIQHASYSLSSVRDPQQTTAPIENAQSSKHPPVSGVSTGDVYKIPLD